MRRLGVFIVGIGLLISGCSEDISLDDVSASDDKITLDSNEKEITQQEETVETLSNSSDTMSYADQYVDFAMEVLSFLEVTYDTIHEENVTIDNKDKLIKSTQELLLAIETYNPSPQNEIDKSLDKHVQRIKYHVGDMNQSAINYINNPNSSDRDLFLEAYESMLNETEILNFLIENL